jgi:hypothetical protein
MKMTREKHLDYMVKMAPFLFFAVVIQIFVYAQFFEPVLIREIGIFLSVGSALILAGFYAHDYFHQVLFQPNYLEIRVSPLRYREEILYRNITGYELKNSKHGFGNVTLHLKEGHKVNIYYLDDTEGFVHQIKRKQNTRI